MQFPSLFCKSSSDVRRVQALFYLNAVIWLVFATAAILRLTAVNPGALALLASLAVLMFGNVLALLIGGLLLGKRNRWCYTLALLVVLVNAVLTITDDFGYFDAIALAVDAATLWFLLKLTPWYWGKPTIQEK